MARSARWAKLVVLASAIVLMAGCTQSSSGSPSTPTSPAVTSQTSTRAGTPTPTVATLRVLEDGVTPAFLLRAGLGQVWGLTSSQTLVRLSADGQATLTVPLDAPAMDLAFAGSDLYVLTASAVERVDPRAGRVLRRYPLTGAGVALAATRKVLYVQVRGKRSQLQSINVATGRTKSLTFATPFNSAMRANSVGVGRDGVVWAIDAADLEEVSVATLTLLHHYALPLYGTALAVAPGGVFVASRSVGDGVARLAPGATSAPICWLGDAQQLVPDGRMLWVSAAAGLTELDGTTCQPVATTPAIDGDNSGDGVAVLPDQVWLAYESGTFQRIAKS